MDRDIVPHGNDILLGRGGKNNQHVGNEQLRSIARSHRDSYRMSTKKGKSHISREIVAYVRRMNPPGRFLKKDGATGNWEDVDDDTAREKVSQVLRDAVSAIKGSSEDRLSDEDSERSPAEATPAFVISTPSSAPEKSRYGRTYNPSRRVSSSDGTRTSAPRSSEQPYVPYSSSSPSSHQYQSPSEPAYRSDQYYHPEHVRSGHDSSNHPGREHYYHRYGYEYETPVNAFEPPHMRQRHFSAPPTVPPVVSNDEIPHSPLSLSAAKRQKQEGGSYYARYPEAYDYSGRVYSGPRTAPSAAAAASAAPASSQPPASYHHRRAMSQEEFDLFNGGLLQTETHYKTDRSRPRDDQEGPYGGYHR